MIMKQESIINRKHGIIDNVPGPGDRNLGRDVVLELGWSWAGMRNKACGWLGQCSCCSRHPRAANCYS